MDFTYQKYEETLSNAIKNKYIISSSQNFINLTKIKALPNKFIILCHDCESVLMKRYYQEVHS